MEKVILSAKGVDKTFGSGHSAVHAVRGVDMDIHEGERVYIHGPSGAGKSTLMQMFGGLSYPSGGKIIFKDVDVYALSDTKRSRLRNVSFGFIFQMYHLMAELNVLENVMMPSLIKGKEPLKKIRERAMGLIDTVGMTERIRHRPGQLSGGEGQRTAIARALMNSPRVLFCDEPTGNLDSEMSEGIYALIKKISSADDMAVVVVSHQEVDRAFFDAEYFMKDGMLENAPDGSPAAGKKYRNVT